MLYFSMCVYFLLFMPSLLEENKTNKMKKGTGAVSKKKKKKLKSVHKLGCS